MSTYKEIVRVRKSRRRVFNAKKMAFAYFNRIVCYLHQMAESDGMSDIDFNRFDWLDRFGGFACDEVELSDEQYEEAYEELEKIIDEFYASSI